MNDSEIYIKDLSNLKAASKRWRSYLKLEVKASLLENKDDVAVRVFWKISKELKVQCPALNVQCPAKVEIAQGTWRSSVSRLSLRCPHDLIWSISSQIND